jgi:hypothetical protein
MVEKSGLGKELYVCTIVPEFFMSNMNEMVDTLSYSERSVSSIT